MISQNDDFNGSIPFSAAALMALMFAVPLILYMTEFDPKPPTQDTCDDIIHPWVRIEELSVQVSITIMMDILWVIQASIHVFIILEYLK